MPTQALQAAATDPYAGIATPIQSAPAASAAAPVSPASDSSDPYASIATPLPAAAPGTTGVSGALNKIGEFGAGVVPGAVESMGETIQIFAVGWQENYFSRSNAGRTGIL